MKNITCTFFGPDYLDLDRLDTYAKWTIENLICDYNITCFLFGSGGDFEKVCYEYIKESKERHRHLKLKIEQCESVLSLENMISKSDVCIFSKCVNGDRNYVCEGVVIGLVANKLDYLHRYALIKQKKIKYI